MDKHCVLTHERRSPPNRHGLNTKGMGEMDIQIGPHWYRNTDGTVEIEGLPQIEIESPGNGRLPRVNFAIFDAVGKMPGKLMNSSLAINEQGAYTLTKEASSLTLKQAESGTEVLHVEFKDEHHVMLPRGEFYTLKGHLLTITPSEWTVEKTTGKEGETDMKGKPATLGV